MARVEAPGRNPDAGPPPAPVVEGPRPGGPVEGQERLDALLGELGTSVRGTASRIAERLGEELWEPMRRSADRLGALRDEALDAGNPLRDAGRAVRVVCSDLEELSAAETLERELGRVPELLLPSAHTLPRTLRREDGGLFGTSRRLPVRRLVSSLLEADYLEELVRRLDPDPLVVDPVAALPEAPADLLGEGDHAGRLLEAVDRAEGRLRGALEGAADGTLRRAGRLLGSPAPFPGPRARVRAWRARARRQDAAEELRERLAASDRRARVALRSRRFAADLARRERALRKAAGRLSERIEEARREAEAIRVLADRLEEAGDRAAGALEDTERRPAEVLDELGSRVRRALVRRRDRLPQVDRPETPLCSEIDDFLRRAHALESMASDPPGPKGTPPRRPGGEDTPGREGAPGGERRSAAGGRAGSGAASGRKELLALRGRIVESVSAAREQVGEAGGIVRHGLEAARAEVTAGSEPGRDGGLPTLLRECCRRGALRLREAATRLEEGLTEASRELERSPDRLLEEIRSRARGQRAGWTRRARGRLRRGVGPLREAWSRVRGGAEALARRVARGSRALRDGPTPAAPAAGIEGEAGRTRGPGERTAPIGVPLGEGGRAEELPAMYRWLFRLEPLDDGHLLVGRAEQSDLLRRVLGRLEEGESCSVAVVGEPESGKTSLLNVAVSDLGGGIQLRRGRVNRRVSSRAECLRWLARFLGLDAPEGVGRVGELAEALGGRREVVVLEGLHRLFRRRVGGYDAVRAFGELVGATRDRMAWVVSCDLEAWRFLRRVSPLSRRFDQVLELPPLSPDETGEVILRRHRLTGYGLRFLPGDALPASRESRLSAAGEEERQELLRRWCFEDLRARAGRTVGTTIRAWRACLLPPVAHEVRVLPVRVPDPGFLEELDRETRFVLAELALHGDLREIELPDLLRRSPDQVAAPLEWLKRTGVVRPVRGHPPPPPLEIDPMLHGPVVDRLRQDRILPA